MSLSLHSPYSTGLQCSSVVLELSSVCQRKVSTSTILRTQHKLIAVRRQGHLHRETLRSGLITHHRSQAHGGLGRITFDKPHLENSVNSPEFRSRATLTTVHPARAIIPLCYFVFFQEQEALKICWSRLRHSHQSLRTGLFQAYSSQRSDHLRHAQSSATHQHDILQKSKIPP